MTADAQHPLGPKGSVYAELAREEWRAPLERSGVRRALVTALLSLALIAMGVVGAVMSSPEALALAGLGVLGIYTTWDALQGMRYEFEESRRVGWVEVTLDEDQPTVGDPLTVHLTWHARRALRVRGAVVQVVERAWRGSVRGETAHQVAASVAGSDSAVPAGDSWRGSATLRMPTDAPPSYYDQDSSVRWSLLVELQFDAVTPWRRELPVMVYPAPA